MLACCRPRKKKKTSQNSHTHKYKKMKIKMKRIYKASDVRDGDGDGLLLIESIDTVSLSFLSFHQSKEEEEAEYLFLNI
jgi:hypothetical protein